MGAVIQFEQHTKWDHRAQHRIFSEPVALDLINDVDALAQEAIAFCHNAHFQALGTGNASLVRTIQLIGGKVTHIRRLAHEAAALAEQSAPVEPWTLFGGDSAA